MDEEHIIPAQYRFSLSSLLCQVDTNLQTASPSLFSPPYIQDYFVLLIKHVLLTSQGDTLNTLLLFLILCGVFLDQLLRHTWEKSTQRYVNKLSKAGRACHLLKGSFSSHFAHSSYSIIIRIYPI